jgi:hypothetical protein
MTDLDELERLHARAVTELATPSATVCLNALPGLLAELRALREVARMAARLTDMAKMGGLRASWVAPMRALSASLDAVPNR